MNPYFTSASIVFIVSNNNPSMFTSNYLVNKKIIPPDAQIESAVTIPQFSQITHAQGYGFEAAEKKVVLSRNYIGNDVKPLAEVTKDEIPDRLLEASLNLADDLADSRLESVGLNFRLFAEGKDLGSLTRNLPEGAEAMELVFAISKVPFHANYMFNLANRTQPPAKGILIDVNFDGQIEDRSSLFARAKEVTGLLNRRSDCFENMKGVLDVLNY